ncbi:peritrophin-1-like [Periplaneta americana]|uniref:peritrophin-1-like n=1 Tax=Periplaneta americana TaxID=6978 RepID=UPI0037E870B1
MKSVVLLLVPLLVSGVAGVTCPASDPVNGSVYFPDACNCTSFYQCSHGKAILQVCPVGLHWNIKKNQCDWPDKAGCVPPSCPGKDPTVPLFFPNPRSCETYFQCSNGILYCRQCPPGLHFNTQLNVCDYSYNVKCSTE